MKYFNQVKQEYIELLPVRMLPKNPYINSVHKDDRERKVKTFRKRLLNFVSTSKRYSFTLYSEYINVYLCTHPFFIILFFVFFVWGGSR